MTGKIAIAWGCLSICGVASAQVPHTFSAGTPAKASEVNDNFAYLASSIPLAYWWQNPGNVTVTATTKAWQASPPHEIAVGTLIVVGTAKGLPR